MQKGLGSLNFRQKRSKHIWRTEFFKGLKKPMLESASDLRLKSFASDSLMGLREGFVWITLCLVVVVIHDGIVIEI